MAIGLVAAGLAARRQAQKPVSAHSAKIRFLMEILGPGHRLSTRQTAASYQKNRWSRKVLFIRGAISPRQTVIVLTVGVGGFCVSY